MKKDGIPSVRTIQRIVASLKAETMARLARDDGSKPCGRFNCPAIGKCQPGQILTGAITCPMPVYWTLTGRKLWHVMPGA